MIAIQHLAGRPVRQAVALTRAERRALRREATAAPRWSFCQVPSDDGVVARWLLHKLDRDPPRRRRGPVEDFCPRVDDHAMSCSGTR